MFEITLGFNGFSFGLVQAGLAALHEHPC